MSSTRRRKGVLVEMTVGHFGTAAAITKPGNWGCSTLQLVRVCTIQMIYWAYLHRFFFHPKYLLISYFIVSIQRRNILLLNPTRGAFQTQIYTALRSLSAPPFVIIMSLSVMSYSTTCFRTALPSVSFQHTPRHAG